jgi:exodeoxyribonuclease VII small subunit
MKEQLTYIEAYAQLEALIEELEDGSIEIDQLAAKVKEANELIAICEAKLRRVDEEVKGVLNEAAGRVKKKGGKQYETGDAASGQD